MSSHELFFLSIVRALVEVAGFSLLGQGVLAIFAGRERQGNVVYRLMQTVSSPAVKLTRAITPRAIIDRHVPLLAFVLLFWLWIALGIAKNYICSTQGYQCGF